LITAEDAIVELYSGQGGSIGSCLNMKEFDGNGLLVDNWTMFRGTPAIGGGLEVRYGPGETTANASIIRMENNGNVGISEENPQAKLHIGGPEGTRKILTAETPYEFPFDIDADSIVVQSNLVALNSFSVAGPSVALFSSGIVSLSDVDIRGDLKCGDLECDVLRINGGADIVEGFNTADDIVAEPGSVMVIDPNTPGALTISTEAYDFKVAGVVSGANGVNPGIHLGQDGLLDGDTKVAMTGRVYVKCSIENGIIQPGDLLTTASIPGHAMKVTDFARGNGSVIGKAMSTLDEETGMVLVLVNLQ
ncbi:MAG: hypothetical protein AAF432_17025, partial [Planctomycetota bacterium]